MIDRVSSGRAPFWASGRPSRRLRDKGNPLERSRSDMVSKDLKTLSRRELVDIIYQMKKMDRYCGLKVGDVENPNNNAGNWE